MKYVMSNIHGCYEKYQEMLGLINFSESDVLYILGDTIDIGTDSVRVLRDMMKRKNIVPIIGNHEYLFYKCMNCASSESGNIPDESLECFNTWLMNGGISTFDEISNLSDKYRKQIADYISSFIPYAEICAGNNKFILVHAGPGNFSENKAMSDYRPEELLFSEPDFDKKYFDDTYLVTAHCPTYKIEGADIGKIFFKNNHIAVNCGIACHEGTGCLRLDDMREFYI